ncbi:MAG: DEAD/DEAH box helicase [Myxococcota bacterium]
MTFDQNRALELLRVGTGAPAATFREGQDIALRKLVGDALRLLVVQKTGWGKSFVYFIATKLLREAGAGPALLVSPLLALMRNQIEAAERMGVRARTLNSSNAEAWSEIEAEIARDEVDILLVSPERFRNDRFTARVLPVIAQRVGLFVVDEAHCISEWGHDFRPDYRRLERIVANLPKNVRFLATTATATNRVVADLQELLGPNLDVVRGDLARPSLTLQTLVMPDRASRLGWLAHQLPNLPGSGIVYVLTVRDAEIVADWLKTRGLKVAAYTGSSDNSVRPELEQALLRNELKALVATSALGMGFDKPDLGFVVHYQSPGNVIAYYQQVGRAGRNDNKAYGVLLSGAEDDDIHDYFIRTAFPSPTEVDAVLAALAAAPDGLSESQLLTQVNLKLSRLQKVLTLLPLESPAPLVQIDKKWMRAPADLDGDFWHRAEQIDQTRRKEWEEMQRYARLPTGHMSFLIAALDGEPSHTSGDPMPLLAATAPAEVVDDARRFLGRSSYPLELRKKWPPDGMARYGVAGVIREHLRAEPGRALGYWGDGLWGAAVQRGKYVDERLSHDLVDACARLLAEWQPQPPPGWVACVPSLRRPTLVPDFARLLAERLMLPFHPVLIQTEARPEQKTMLNTQQQARNLDGSLSVAGAVPSGPVLLVDDIVSSRWTLTVAAWLLRSHGAGAVFPLVLAIRGGGDE